MDEERINDLEVGEEIILVDSFGNIKGVGTVERIRGRNFWGMGGKRFWGNATEDGRYRFSGDVKLAAMRPLDAYEYMPASLKDKAMECEPIKKAIEEAEKAKEEAEKIRLAKERLRRKRMKSRRKWDRWQKKLKQWRLEKEERFKATEERIKEEFRKLSEKEKNENSGDAQAVQDSQ